MYKVGSMPPKGYLQWHEWAEIQGKGGLKQAICPKCLRWLFPQEVKTHGCERTGGRDGFIFQQNKEIVNGRKRGR